MAIFAVRSIKETLLTLESEAVELTENHILEPEYHQEKYVSACEQVAALPGAFQLGTAPGLVDYPARGSQPSYADDEHEPGSLDWEGMTTCDGAELDSDDGKRNICALKSNCVRRGFVDYSLARSVTRAFHKLKKKSNVQPNDILINSTGDGTIGRVAAFNAKFPAVADGHITMVRFTDPDDAWYIAAFLMSDLGQRQIYRYINGSSGQVEIYPQDIARIWIKPPKSKSHKKAVADGLRAAAAMHLNFYRNLQAALAAI
jgi:hypothetical protein